MGALVDVLNANDPQRQGVVLELLLIVEPLDQQGRQHHESLGYFLIGLLSLFIHVPLEKDGAFIAPHQLVLHLLYNQTLS